MPCVTDSLAQTYNDELVSHAISIDYDNDFIKVHQIPLFRKQESSGTGGQSLALRSLPRLSISVV